MTQIEPAHYTYRVTWSAEDGEYVAACLELPSLSWLAATPQDALAAVEEVVAEAVADMREDICGLVSDELGSAGQAGRPAQSGVAGQ